VSLEVSRHSLEVVARQDQESNKIVQEVEERRQIERSRGKTDGITAEDEKAGTTG
jgi:hypothetical protein